MNLGLNEKISFIFLSDLLRQIAGLRKPRFSQINFFMSPSCFLAMINSLLI